MKEKEETKKINELENQRELIEEVLVEQARESSRGLIHDIPRWME